MIRVLRVALVVLVAVLAFAAARATYADDPAAVVVQAAHDSGLSAKGSDITWPTAAAVTAWRFIDLLHKAVDRIEAFFTRWMDRTEGRIPISVRYTAVSTHTEVDPDPTKPIMVSTSEYQGPDRRSRGGKRPKLVDSDEPSNR